MRKDMDKTKNQFMQELAELHQQVAELKVLENECKVLQEKKLEASAIIEGMLDAVVILELDGTIRQVNTEFERGTGWKREEVIGKTPVKIGMMSKVEGQKVEKELLPRLEKVGVIRDIETIVIRKDRTRFPALMSWTLMKDAQGKPLGIISIAKDIMKLKQAEEALKDSEERFRTLYKQSSQREQLYESLLNSTPDAVAIYNLYGEVIYINPAFTQIFGFTLEEVKGNRIPFVPESENEKTMAGIQRVLKGEPITGFESKRLTKDGRVLDITLSSSCYHDHEEKLAGIVLILRDVTETKQTERQLRHAQKMKAIGTLAGGLAHDFNNMLQTVQGYTQLTLIDKDRDDPGYEDLKQIVHTVQKGSELTQQLLTFSRKVESKRQPIDLNHEVSQVRKLLMRTIPKMIEIELHLADDLRTINADSVQVEQVLMNLAVNARDAMPEGGKLVIETENITLDEEYCRTHLEARPGDYVLLSISDTGHGMDKKILEHIFEPFFSTKEVGKGTGLGLAMVYGIVKSHDGYITCYSEPDKGTTSGSTCQS